MTLKEIVNSEEKQIFDRKSIDIDVKALAITIVAFANADGGDIAIGISDKTKRIDGTDYDIEKLNELLRAPYDFCEPSVPVQIDKIACVDEKGRKNHIVVMHIEPSLSVHANQADEAYLRVGDKSKKLTFEERTQLMYDKGERNFEDKAVADATMEDIDLNLVQAYIEKINYGKTATQYLRENKGFVKMRNGREQISGAAILLFGKNPQLFFPRARIRFIRYEGTEEKFGAEMNVIKDVVFEGTVLKMITDCIAFLDTQIKEKTYLGKDGLFVTEEEYPKFVRQEIIVNAVAHRAYSISGTDIQVKLFDDRIVVESPGKLPGLVRTDNIRYTHFSRNPRIAEFLKAYKFVKEYGEGVDRMCKELEEAGLQAPEYYSNAFILKTVVRNANSRKPAIGDEKLAIREEKLAIGGEKLAIKDEKLAIREEKLTIGGRKLAISDEKLAIGDIKLAIAQQKYKKPTEKNILQIYKNIDANQVFGTGEIVGILDCSSSSAKELIKKLREMELICEVKGKGKGKYRFMSRWERYGYGGRK